MSNSVPTSNNPSGASSGLSAIAAVSGMVASAKEKFNASGGNEAFSSVASSLPQGTKDLLSQSNFFKREDIRSVSVFFGIGEEKPFYLEKIPSLVTERLRHNVSFFYFNYFLLTAVLFCLTLLVSPGAIIGIGILGFAWLAVIRATSEGSCKVGPITVSQKQATVAMSVFSGLILLKLLSSVFWWTVGSSGCIVGAHALFRDASMHKDEEDRIEMTGDIGLGGAEEDAFLNTPLTTSGSGDMV
mmetsp:Transcript_14364/g.17460  ORF Transcript_14364/g.17460 Transcript_14364/m.17460 type:complete len:243 (-) Transcript_14364:275-1003(-)